MVGVNVEPEDIELLDRMTESIRSFNTQLAESISLVSELDAGLDSLIEKMVRLTTVTEETAAVLPGKEV
mgnify:FL=1